MLLVVVVMVVVMMVVVITIAIVVRGMVRYLGRAMVTVCMEVDVIGWVLTLHVFFRKQALPMALFWVLVFNP